MVLDSDRLSVVYFAPTPVPAIIVGFVFAAVAGLSIWYLVQPELLLVQGEVDATRLDMAARVDGRAADIPVERGQNIAAGAVLVQLDNPENIAKHEQALAAKVVADAQLANINAGTRPEVIADHLLPIECESNSAHWALPVKLSGHVNFRVARHSD